MVEPVDAIKATDRLQIGSGVNLVPNHDPNHTAKTRASLDVLSGGRVLWGVGTGWIDEEMANMIRFQRSYQASARTMSAMDEMLETLISRTGRVGL